MDKGQTLVGSLDHWKRNHFCSSFFFFSFFLFLFYGIGGKMVGWYSVN